MFFLTLALAIEVGLTSQYPPKEITELCEVAKEEEYLAALSDDELRTDEPEWFIHAIECLGEVKSIAAVNPLISLLPYRRSFWWDGTGIVPRIIMPTERYPAGEALGSIGELALPSVIRKIASSAPSSVECEVLFYTLVTIFRNEQEKGLSFIKKSAIVEETLEGRQRLLVIAGRYAKLVGLEDR